MKLYTAILSMVLNRQILDSLLSLFVFRCLCFTIAAGTPGSTLDLLV